MSTAETRTRSASGLPIPSTGRTSAFWRRKKFLIVVVVVALAIGYLTFVAIQNYAMYYLTVGELLDRADTSTGERLRMGGTVAQESVHTEPSGMTLHFEATDGQRNIPVTYTGVVPDAFQPGGDVVVEGLLTLQGTFEADILLAKCPSKYVPSL